MKIGEIRRCLCDETRLRILHLLTRRPMCVCHFQDVLGLPQVAVSKHLAYLRKRELVETCRHKQWMIYSLPKNLPPEFEFHIRCLKHAAQTRAEFKADLRRLEAVQSEYEWVAVALRNPSSSTKKEAVTA